MAKNTKVGDAAREKPLDTPLPRAALNALEKLPSARKRKSQPVGTLSDGWTKNAAGEFCYKGHCFTMTVPPKGEIRLDFDKSCKRELSEKLAEKMIAGEPTRYKLERPDKDERAERVVS